MPSNEEYNIIANRLAEVESKFIEAKAIIKLIDIWVKENDYDIMPVMKLLNTKISELDEIFKSKLFN